jgi:hypothetical protein
MKTSLLIVLAVVLVGCGKPRHTAVSITSVPRFSEQEVREFVTPGRTAAEVTNRFGVPGSVMTNDGHVTMWFCNPFDTISRPLTNPFAFSASFTNGMVEKWGVLRVTMHPIK